MGKRKFSASAVYNNLMKMAKTYGVDKNALFVSAAHQYQVQQTVIEKIREQIDGETALVVGKEYVKDRENVYVHPLIKELPKHSESANRTAATMLSIIQTLGHEAAAGSKLTAFNKRFEDE